MSVETVLYLVPVYVTVDVTARKVLRVQVDDENAELAGDDSDSDAVRIAESESWPAWDIG